MANFCILTGVEINEGNDSKAHVLPSALGGRLKPTGILSKDANTRIGDLIDLPLTKAFQPIMTLIGGSRDRGKNHGVRMTDSKGRAFILNFDEPIQATRPEFQSVETAAGTEINISARNMSELRTLLGKVQKQFPNFDIDEGMKHARHVERWPDDYFHHQLQIGPGVVFPALFVAASVFAVHHGFQAHPEFKRYVDAFDPNNATLPPNTFYFILDEKWMLAKIVAGHTIGLVACPERKQMLVCIDIFNCMPVAVVLPYEGSDRVQASYGVDVTIGSEVPVEIDATIYEIPWSQTHSLDQQALRDRVSAGVSRLIQLSYQRHSEKEVEDAFSRALPDDLDKLSDDNLIAVAEEITGVVLRRLTMPSVSYDHADKSLELFDNLTSQLEVVAQDVVFVRNGVRPLRDKFVDIVTSAKQWRNEFQ